MKQERLKSILLALGENLLIFIFYGTSGGSNEAKDETEAVTEATCEEMEEDKDLPTIITAHQMKSQRLRD